MVRSTKSVLCDKIVPVQEDDAVLQEGMENNHFVQIIIINIVKVRFMTTEDEAHNV